MKPSLTARVLGLPKLNRVRSLNFASVFFHVGFSVMCHFNKKGQFLLPLCWMCSIALFHPSDCRGPEHVTPLQKFSWQSPRSVSALIRAAVKKERWQQGPVSPSRAPFNPRLCAGPHLCCSAAVQQLSSHRLASPRVWPSSRLGILAWPQTCLATAALLGDHMGRV